MLCAPAKSPDGSSRPAQGTDPHTHKTWEVCTERASTPHQKHASAQGDSQHTGGGDITRSGCWLSAAVLIKQRTSPGRSVYGLMTDRSFVLIESGRVCGGDCAGVVVGIWLWTGPSLQLEF